MTHLLLPEPGRDDYTTLIQTYGSVECASIACHVYSSEVKHSDAGYVWLCVIAFLALCAPRKVLSAQLLLGQQDPKVIQG